jgi:hypothetical protein
MQEKLKTILSRKRQRDTEEVKFLYFIQTNKIMTPTDKLQFLKISIRRYIQKYYRQIKVEF